ncbi:MAG: DMT family transporter [Neomegalonema sp.]|nr:DMT family transporter [Neomegalonema sp.]
MTRRFDLAATALAPVVWGSTYYVTTAYLPADYPLTIAALRALPAGLLLLLLVRKAPPLRLAPRIFILGAFNFTLFWSCLFIAAYSLPGGVAATLGAVQPMFVLLLANILLGSTIYARSAVAALAGVCGVALLVLGPEAALDPTGVAAGLLGAAAMAAGTVLTRKWGAGESLLTLTAWQLCAGGLLLLPIALLLEPPPPSLSYSGVGALGYLSVIGGAATYYLWFRGVARIEPTSVSLLGFLSPMTAVTLGWMWRDEGLTPQQIAGAAIVLGSVWWGQQAAPRREASTPHPS